MEPELEAREIAKRYLAAANAHDIEAMVEFWEPGGQERFPPFEDSFRIPDEFSVHMASLFRAFPDLRWTTISLTGDGELVAVRSTMEGTHLGPYRGITATGKAICVDTVDFLTIRAGKIISNDVLFDGLSVMRQTGVLPPTGSLRERTLQKAFTVSLVGSKRVVSGASATMIHRPAKDVLEFVLDLDRYREADRKFHHIHYVERHGDQGCAKYSGRLRGIRTPSEIQDWTLEPYRRLEFRSRPSLWPGLFARFQGTFECKETPEGTLVRHRETFEFTPPLSWVAVPFLRSWLQIDVEEEVIRLKRLLEAGP